MTTYSARYRLPGDWRWTKVTGIKGDGIEPINQPAFQFLYLTNNCYIRLPLNAVVEFSSDRHSAIVEKMEKESGQTIKTL